MVDKLRLIACQVLHLRIDSVLRIDSKTKKKKIRTDSVAFNPELHPQW
jgi:hypothetical protein